MVKRLKRNMGSLKIELDNLNKYVDRKTVVDLIQEIVLLLIGKKGKASCCSFYSSKSSEDSDSVKIIKKSHGHRVREERAIPHKQ